MDDSFINDRFFNGISNTFAYEIDDFVNYINGVNYKYVVKLDLWTKEEASLFLSGFSRLEDLFYDPWLTMTKRGRIDDIRNNSFDYLNYHKIRQTKGLLEASIMAGNLSPNGFPPKTIIKWAMDKGLDIHTLLREWYEKQELMQQNDTDLKSEIERLTAENESLKRQLEIGDQNQTINNQQISPDLEKSYLKIIGALLEVINGTAPPKNNNENTKIRQHPSFTSQADLVTFIAENETYKKAHGLGKTSLDSKFANAKRTLDESLK